MPDAIFDGSSAVWTPLGGAATTIEPLTEFDYADNIAEIDSSGSTDTFHTHEALRSDEVITLGGLGAPGNGCSAGAIGALAVSLFDGGTNTFARCLLSEVSAEGRVDDAIKTSFKAIPAGPNAVATHVAHTGPTGADVAFMGTTVTFGGAGLAGLKLVSVRVTCMVAAADVGGSDDSTKLSAPAKPQWTIEVEVVGSATVARGAEGGLAVNWANGANFGSLANAVCTKRGRGSSMGNTITTKYTFRPRRS